MARTKTKNIHPRNSPALTRQMREMFVEADSMYLLKLVIIVILGTLWIKFKLPISWNGVLFNGLPLGLIVGLASIRLLEKNAIDRKIWYAVLIIVAVISYFVPAGIVI